MSSRHTGYRKTCVRLVWTTGFRRKAVESGLETGCPTKNLGILVACSTWLSPGKERIAPKAHWTHCSLWNMWGRWGISSACPVTLHCGKDVLGRGNEDCWSEVTLPPARFLGDRFDARQCVFKERQSNAIVICGMWSHWTRGTDVAMVKLDCRFAKQFCGCVIQRLIFGKCFTHKKSNRQGCCLDGNHQRKDWIKCNSDDAFYSDGSGATGAVLRDHHGWFKGGWARWYATCMDVLTIEALACVTEPPN